MNLKFNIEGKSLIHIKTHYHKKTNDSFCSFRFITSEWNNIEKYVIFSNNKGDNTILSLGSSNSSKCILPNFIIKDHTNNHFYIQIYANDNLQTDKIKVNKLKSPKIKEIDNLIDKIVYEDNQLLLYSENNLVKTIEIIDKNSVKKIFKNSFEAWLKNYKNELSNVATTGEYSDLLNIPIEFTPKSHTHGVEDINETELNDFCITRINLLLDDLADEINKE